jgi:predicted GIY-YIG superfamily endonuclease
MLVNKIRRWTFETCKEEALKFSSRLEFQKKSSSAWGKCRRNNWLDDVCTHMTELRKPKGYWTLERCKKESLKYTSRLEFKNNSSSVWGICRNNNWLDDVCNHMKLIGNKYKRCIYSYEFYDNSVYVGLTNNLDKRNSEHINNKNSLINKKILQNINYNFKQLTEYINVEDATNMEKYYVDYYQKNNFDILNKKKAGGLGGNFLKWSDDDSKKEAIKYESRKEFKINSPRAYEICRKNKWLDDVCGHMVKWTFEKCHQLSLECGSRNEFKNKYITAYRNSNKNGWMDCYYPKK